MSKQLSGGGHIGSPYGDELANGRVEGMTKILKFGKNPDVDTSIEDIWDGGGTYLFPTSADQLEISSTSALDSSTATGARTIRLEGLDASFATQNETVTMTGTAAATTANSYIRLHRMKIITAGTNEAGVGSISAVHPSASATMAKIRTPWNQTQMAIFTIPAGKTGLIKRYYGGVNIKTVGTAEVSLWIRPENEVFRLNHLQPANPKFNHSFEEDPLPVAAKSDIKMRASTSVNNMDVNAGFDVRMEEA